MVQVFGMDSMRNKPNHTGREMEREGEDVLFPSKTIDHKPE